VRYRRNLFAEKSQMMTMNEKQRKKELINWQFVESDLFDHLFAYIRQLTEISESLYLELDDLQKRASEFEAEMKKEIKKRKQNE
jgi:hypothetical protein